MGNYPLNNYEDEIKLIDLWRILVLQKRVIFIVTIIVTCCAFFYLLLVKPIYESKVVVQVGQVGQVGLLEDVNVLKQRLVAERPNLVSAEVEKDGATSIIIITLQGSTSAEAEQGLRGIVERLLHAHETSYNFLIAQIQQRQEALVKDVNDLKKQRVEVSKIKNKMSVSNPALAVLLVSEIRSLGKEVGEKEEAAFNLQMAGGRQQARRTKVVGEFFTSASPVKPKRQRVLALGVVLGSMLGILGAFGVNAVGQQKKKNK